MEYNLKVVELNKQTDKLKRNEQQVYKTILIKKDGQVGMSQKSMMSINLLDEQGIHKVGDVLKVTGEIHQAKMLNQAGEQVTVQWFEPA